MIRALIVLAAIGLFAILATPRDPAAAVPARPAPQARPEPLRSPMTVEPGPLQVIIDQEPDRCPCPPCKPN
jgi:hypothetical protein